MEKIYNSTIIQNEEIAKNIFHIIFENQELANSANPGQFIEIYFSDGVKIFPRPFSIGGAAGDKISIIYKVVGTQTEKMSMWKSGVRRRILGPLGNGFEIDESVLSHVLIGGGVGAPPVLFLRDELYRRNIKAYLFLGAGSKSEHFLLQDEKSSLHLSSDDGSIGFEGNVGQHFLTLINSIKKPINIYACGPEKMNQALKKIGEEKNIKVQLSMEKVMACGMGICQGCAIKTIDGSGEEKYSLVCKDGPVFDAEEICFDG